MRVNYRDEYGSYKKKSRFYIPIFYFKYLIKYLHSSFLNILWGYGEKPSRVFTISIVSVLLFAIVFCYSPNASLVTQNKPVNSLYYSLVTFTLGIGETYQTDSFLKILSGFEAILGMSFWGILIAGFANNSKDY